jgi:cellobiose dehydrogenase (acceptor)
MTITQYLGMGTTSRGRADITPQLNMRVITNPYLRNAPDKEAMIAGLDFVRSALGNVQNLTWITPTSSQTTTAFVNSVRIAKPPYKLRCILIIATDPSHTRLPRL